MDGDITKRMGENIGRPFVIGISDEGREGTDGRILPVYSIEAGGSGRMTIGCGVGRAYTIGDSVGRYTMSDEGST